MIPYEPGYFDRLKADHPFPRYGIGPDKVYKRFEHGSPVDGWRVEGSTKAEEAAAAALREKERKKQERGKPLTVIIRGEEYARRLYIHRIAAELSGVPYTYIKAENLTAFLSHREGGGRMITRRRIVWGLYFHVTEFRKAWQKRLITLSRRRKMRQGD